jgi:predicted Zn finger-like uncharacterized protein
MPITITCPSCHQKLGVPDDATGKSIRCPKCLQVFKAPALEPPIEAILVEPSSGRFRGSTCVRAFLPWKQMRAFLPSGGLVKLFRNTISARFP